MYACMYAAEADDKALETGAANPPAIALLNYVLESIKQAETRATDERARTEKENKLCYESNELQRDMHHMLQQRLWIQEQGKVTDRLFNMVDQPPKHQQNAAPIIRVKLHLPR